MPTSESKSRPLRSFVFGAFVLVPERQLLLRNDVPVRIGNRALDILTILVERAGEIVGKRDLMARVWPGRIVEEGNLKVNMAALRRALGKDALMPAYIATVVGRGYRFVVPVEVVGEPMLSPASTRGLKRHDNLPLAATSLLGRANVKASICEAIRDARLVSIVGPGGAGKTTLALAAGRDMIGDFKDGVWLVDLAPLRYPSAVPEAIAAALGLPPESAYTATTLSQAFCERDTLLIIDNCEHLVDAVASCVEQVLADAPGVKCLTTSREPLLLKGERVYRLGGLPLPPAAKDLTADLTRAFAAVDLFVARANDRDPDFRLTDDNAPIVAEICRKVDGLPLALELAATRIDTFSLRQLLTQLDDPFRLLSVSRGGPERHRTLVALLDWSFDLLSDTERLLMGRLAALQGPFSLRSVFAVAVEELDLARVSMDLANLVSKSLILTIAAGEDVAYCLAYTTRTYFLTRMKISGDGPGSRQKPAD